MISTRKIRYVDAGDPMPTLLTIYNPGAAREFRLLILLHHFLLIVLHVMPLLYRVLNFRRLRQPGKEYAPC